MINIQLSINVNQVEQFFDNFRFDVNGNRLATDFAPFTPPTGSEQLDVYDPEYFEIPLSGQGFWKERTVGPNNFQLVDVLVKDYVVKDWTDPLDPDPGDVLAVIHYMREVFPGALVILDAFDFRTGLRHGQASELTQTGTQQVEVLERVVTTTVEQRQIGVDENGDPFIVDVTVPKVEYVGTGVFTDEPIYTEAIIGQPTYPPIPKAEMLEYMPDDSPGVPATGYKQVVVTYGQRDRRYE